MRYSVTLIALLLFLALASITTGMYAVQYSSLFFAVTCLMAAASAILLGLLRPAARYLFYVTAALIAYWWIEAVIAVIREGWPYMDPISSVVSLIPGALLISICVFGSVYVHRITKRAAA